MSTKLVRLFVSFAVFVMLFGCTTEDKRTLRVAVSPWIGYAPLIYADEKGWLVAEQVKLVHSTSLLESIDYFRNGLVDGFAATQFDIDESLHDNLAHLIALDRSNGGDVVLSNYPLEKLLDAEMMRVYLEIDSVNKPVFDAFVKQHGIDHAHYTIENMSQIAMTELSPRSATVQVITTYEPYASMLRKKGFHEVGSTRDSEILVLDSVYLNKEIHTRYPKQAKAFTALIRRAYRAYLNNSDEFYDTVSKHFSEMDRKEFFESVDLIEWLIEIPREEYNAMVAGHNILPIKEQ